MVKESVSHSLLNVFMVAPGFCLYDCGMMPSGLSLFFPPLPDFKSAGVRRPRGRWPGMRGEVVGVRMVGIVKLERELGKSQTD